MSLPSGTITLNWVDTLPAGTTYTIMQSGASTAAGTITAKGNNGALSWSSLAAGTYVVFAGTNGTVLKTASGASSVAPPVPGTTPAIVADQTTQPFSGDVSLSVTPASTYSAAQWTMDGAPLGTASGGTNAITWHTINETSHGHEIAVRLKSTTDYFYMVRSNFGVVNPTFNVTVNTIGASGIISIDGQYTTANPTTANLTIDGAAAGSLAAPNICLGVACQGTSAKDAFRFSVDTSTLAIGNHVGIVTVNDNAGNSVRQVFSFPTTH